MKITKVEVLRVKTNRPSWRPIFAASTPMRGFTEMAKPRWPMMQALPLLMR